MTGIQETKEAIKGIAELLVVVKDLAKDGIDLSDAVALGSKIVSDEAFRGALIKAVQGAQNIPAEIKDLDAAEVGELLGVIANVLSGKSE
jgi:hypothetical protein